MSTSELIQHVIDKNPVAFGDAFNSALDERIAGLVAQRKEQLSQSLFRDQEESDD